MQARYRYPRPPVHVSCVLGFKREPPWLRRARRIVPGWRRQRVRCGHFRRLHRSPKKRRRSTSGRKIRIEPLRYWLPLLSWLYIHLYECSHASVHVRAPSAFFLPIATRVHPYPFRWTVSIPHSSTRVPTLLSTVSFFLSVLSCIIVVISGSRRRCVVYVLVIVRDVPYGSGKSACLFRLRVLWP